MFLRSTKYQLLIFAHFQRLPSWEPTSSPKERKSPRRTQKVDFTSTWLRSLRLVMFVSKTMIKVSSRPSHLNRVKHAEQSLFRQNWYNWASASLQYTANNTQAGVFTCMCVCVSIPIPTDVESVMNSIVSLLLILDAEKQEALIESLCEKLVKFREGERPSLRMQLWVIFWTFCLRKSHTRVLSRYQKLK